MRSSSRALFSSAGVCHVFVESFRHRAAGPLRSARPRAGSSSVRGPRSLAWSRAAGARSRSSPEQPVAGNSGRAYSLAFVSGALVRIPLGYWLSRSLNWKDMKEHEEHEGLRDWEPFVVRSWLRGGSG